MKLCDSPFFSVVIPVHNKGPHIKRSIDSVLLQSYKQFELILIDDASNDDSLMQMTEYADHRIRIISRSVPGPGGYAARNLGIAEAKSDWIAFLDADDEWCPDHLEKMKLLIGRFPKASFLACGWKTSNENGVVIDPYYSKNSSRGPHEIDVETYLELCLNNLKPVNSDVACIRKSCLISVDLFPADSGAKRGGDLHAWLKLICHQSVMAWSNHIGAIYHLDSVNMVTKTAGFSPSLMTRGIFSEFAKNLSSKEGKLLAKYLNIRLGRALLGISIANERSWKLIKLLYWREDFFVSCMLSLLFILPASWLNSLNKIRTKIKVS